MTAPIHQPTRHFKKLIADTMAGEVLAPHIRNALWDPNFKGFTIEVEGFIKRDWDGWFHPSTHPTWPARLLWYYLAHDPGWEDEPFDPSSTMAVTQGKFWHEFIQKLGIGLGILKDPGVCICGCGKQEWYVEDPLTGSRGHYDGLVNAATTIAPEDEVFEFKTMRPLRYHKLPILAPDNPKLLAAWRDLEPSYYGQGQDYMRMTGYRRHRTLVLSMEYPFDMREIVMPYDWGYAGEIGRRYMAVRQDRADHRLPDACCTPRSPMSKKCPARAICPVGRGEIV